MCSSCKNSSMCCHFFFFYCQLLIFIKKTVINKTVIKNNLYVIKNTTPEATYFKIYIYSNSLTPKNTKNFSFQYKALAFKLFCFLKNKTKQTKNIKNLTFSKISKRFVLIKLSISRLLFKEFNTEHKSTFYVVSIQQLEDCFKHNLFLFAL